MTDHKEREGRAETKVLVIDIVYKVDEGVALPKWSLSKIERITMRPNIPLDKVKRVLEAL